MHRRSHQRTRYRPRVTSCQLCRPRKLRCNRQFPCSNCTARGVSCQAASAHQPTGRRAGANMTPPTTVQISNDELLKRLESLEALLTAQTQDPETAQPMRKLREDTNSQNSPPNALCMLSDVLVLERHCMSSKAGDSATLNSIVFYTCPIRLITRPYSFIFQNSSPPSAVAASEPIKCVWLPEREDTRRIVDKYLNDISFIHHVIHAPTVRRLVDHVHDAVGLGHQPPMGPVALLLAIFANATGLWTARDLSRNLFYSVSEAHSQASVWQKAGLDVLDHLQQHSHVSLEATQALVILCYSVVNLGGVSAMFRNLFSRAITMARELGLHCIDSPQRLLGAATPRYTALEAEIGRRVWWYLSSTDWILAGLSGTLGNVCMINSSQMAVKKPRNIDDVDLIEGEEIVDKPMDQPTCMSFYLQRIRIAEIFRASLEQTHFAALSPEAISSQQVQELDAQMARFWDGTPAILRLNHDLQTVSDNSNNMGIQRYVLHLFVHGQRCKIHLPYLARGVSYATSRAASVESARFIIRMDQHLGKEQANFASSRLRLSIVLHHIFLAFVVLLFDLCLDAERPTHINKSAEAAAAWKILQGAKAQLQQAEVLIEPLHRVMKRYNILHDDQEGVPGCRLADDNAQNAVLDSSLSEELGVCSSTATTEGPMQLVEDWNNLRVNLALSNNG